MSTYLHKSWRDLNKLIAIITFFLIGPYVQGKELMTVVYPKGQSVNDKRRSDVVELIQLALEHTKEQYGPYSLRESSRTMTIPRQVIELQRNQEINIAWFDTTNELENKLLPISIPVQMGLVGFRILLIKEKDQQKFSKIKDVKSLKPFFNGLLSSWNNKPILAHNNLPFVEGTTYEGLFRMLQSGRFDYFSRGINEAYKELSARPYLQKNVIVESNIALHYKHYNFLFTSRSNKRLNNRINDGLKILMTNGKFIQVFCRNNYKSIKKAKLNKRTIIHLENPIIPQKLKIAPRFLYDPHKDFCR